MNRSISRISFAVSAVALVHGLGGCAGQGDIDRSQPDKIPKAMFLAADGKTPKVFYYRQTYVDVPATSGWTFEGMMGISDKIRFDIRESFLYGYRSYDYAPGTNSAFNGGGNNQDTPLLVFKILSHFDVKREYNAGTGEQTNVISENTSDRPWYDRDYMRVDWSRNLAEVQVDASSPSALFLPTTRPADQRLRVAGRHRQSRSAHHLGVVLRRDRARDPHARLRRLHDAVPPRIR